MTTLTLDQQTALDFYSEFSDKVQYFGLTILADREERLLYRQGKKLIEQVLTKKSPNKLEFYTNEERLFIAVGYNQGQTRKEIVTGFVKQFGNTHTQDSVGQKVEMIKSVDSTHPSHRNFQFRDEELLIILQDLDSDRYTV
jgi:hypothetical protein